MWNITNRWRQSVWACQNKTRQWDQLWTTKCGEEDKEEGESWTNGVPRPGKRSVWGWYVTTEWKICVFSNNTNTIIITCTESWVFQTFPIISTRAWLHWKLIHTSEVCLKINYFLTSKHPTCIVQWLHLVNIISLVYVQVLYMTLY